MTVMTHWNEALAITLFVLRIVSPAVVLLGALSLVFAKASPPPSPSPVVSVVVASRVPRRGLILALLSLAALSYLGDGLTSVAYAVLNKFWSFHHGVEIGAVVGLVAYSAFAILGATKDVAGIDVWSLRRVKSVVAVALLLDIAQVILYGLAVNERIKEGRSKCSLFTLSSNHEQMRLISPSNLTGFPFLPLFISPGLLSESLHFFLFFPPSRSLVSSTYRYQLKTSQLLPHLPRFLLHLLLDSLPLLVAAITSSMAHLHLLLHLEATPVHLLQPHLLRPRYVSIMRLPLIF